MESIKSYAAKEIFWIIITGLIAAFILFALIRLGIEDPIAIKFPKADPEIREILREELGYNRPLIIQYAAYMWRFVQGDMGESIRYIGRDVWGLLRPRFWITMQLGFAATLIGMPLGVILGMVAARFRNSWFDTCLISFLTIFSVLPAVIFIQLCIFVFVLQLGWLPPGGWDGLFSKNIIIPLISLILPGLVGGVRFTRINILHVIEEDYVFMAYAKGLSEKKIFLRHILPNAAPPILYIFIISLTTTMLTGFFFVELIYGIRGMGTFMLESIRGLDYDVIMAASIIITFFALVSRRVADIALGILDPRIRVGLAKKF